MNVSRKTLGVLAAPKAHLFLIDYRNRRRIKIWGTARVVENDAALLQSLKPANYRARLEQAVLFTVSAWDVNCPQHIPQRFEAADVRATLETRDQRIAELQAEVDRLPPLRAPATEGPSAVIQIDGVDLRKADLRMLQLA